MKKRILLIMLLCIGLYTKAQSILSVYEQGKQLSTCEDNFDNLFKNWNDWYQSSSIKLISFKFVETLDTPKRVAFYRDYFFNPATMYSSITMSSKNDHIVSRSILLLPYAYHSGENGDVKSKSLYDANVFEGDKVYGVTYDHMGKRERVAYVICNPKTCRVVWDVIFERIPDILRGM